MMSTPGDLNHDGKLDREDLDILKAILAEQGFASNMLDLLTPDQRAIIDVNRDGQLDDDDVEALLQLILQQANTAQKDIAERFNTLRQKNRP